MIAIEELHFNYSVNKITKIKINFYFFLLFTFLLLVIASDMFRVKYFYFLTSTPIFYDTLFFASLWILVGGFAPIFFYLFIGKLKYIPYKGEAFSYVFFYLLFASALIYFFGDWLVYNLTYHWVFIVFPFILIIILKIINYYIYKIYFPNYSSTYENEMYFMCNRHPKAFFYVYLLLIPFVVELFFRLVLYGSINIFFNPFMTHLLTGLIYGFTKVPNLKEIHSMFFYVGISIIYSLTFELSGNIAVLVFVHSTVSMMTYMKMRYTLFKI